MQVDFYWLRIMMATLLAMFVGAIDPQWLIMYASYTTFRLQCPNNFFLLIHIFSAGHLETS